MKTLVIWLIDKIRYLAGIIFIIVAVRTCETNEHIAFWSVILGAISISPLPLGTGILMYIIPTVCSVILSYNTPQFTIFMFYHILALSCAILSAIFLYRNFDIVTSRRFRYHNSRLSEWQLQWLYSIKNSANVYLFVLSVIYLLIGNCSVV